MWFGLAFLKFFRDDGRLSLFNGANFSISFGLRNLGNWALFIRESLLVELLLAVSVVALVAEGTFLAFLVEFAHHCLVFMRVRCCHLVPDRLLQARLHTCSFW